MKYLIILLITSSAYAFEPSSYKWSTRKITWKADVDLRDLTIQAINTWNGNGSNYNPLNSYFEFIEVQEDAQINVVNSIDVQPDRDGECKQFVLGNEIYKAEIRIFIKKSSLGTLILHEFGHALGLGHTDIEDAIMCPKFKDYKTLHKDDVEAICKLYNIQVQEPDLSVEILKKKGNLYLLSCKNVVDWIYADGWIDRQSKVVSHKFRNFKSGFVTVEYRGWSQTVIVKKRRN